LIQLPLNSLPLHPVRKLLDKYYGIFRKVKANYVLLNLAQYGKLKHNKQLYRNFGLNKSIIAPISSEDFKNLPQELPWLDRPDSKEQLEWNPEFVIFDEPTKAQLRQWPDNGYMVLKSFFSESEVDSINQEVDRLIKDKVVDFNFTGRKIMFAHKHSDLLKGIAKNSKLNALLSFVLGRKVMPFQTINFFKGSEQRAHSDFIHMTTHPKGNLIAAWIALEEITADNGPLIYYPGSHQLPYLLNTEYNHGGNSLMIGDDAYLRYEEEVQKRISENHLQPKEFHAKKGDVLIWHANLLHAGKAILNENLTRKSMVVHFYAEGVICYHDLTQRPAILEQI
jgi:ectoine hydroxylase